MGKMDRMGRIPEGRARTKRPCGIEITREKKDRPRAKPWKTQRKGSNNGDETIGPVSVSLSIRTWRSIALCQGFFATIS